MNELLVKDDNIQNMIYKIRGKEVMLDFDLAKIYECANGTKSINLAVKRHLNRFPERFMFQLTEEECYSISRFQFETLKQGNNIKHDMNNDINNQSSNLRFRFETSSLKKEYGGRRYNPYAFTEQGVAMLATVLRSEKAIETSIRIMDAFVKMRHFISDNKDIYKSLNRIDNKLEEHDEKLSYLFSKFDKKEKILLEGESYDAYLNILEILNYASKNIIVIDNYADRVFLDLIKNIKVKVILITLDSNRLSDIEITKYNKEYHNLEIIRNNSFHDRLIVIDNKEIYHLGSSINSLGDKLTSIIKLEDKNNIKALLITIDKIIDNTSKI